MSDIAAPSLASGGNTRTTISGEAKASPATPTPLFVAAPAMPEMCVPCPSSSVGIPAEQLPPRHVALAVETRPARSSCVASTPVSTTASAVPCTGENVPGKADQPAAAGIGQVEEVKNLVRLGVDDVEPGAILLERLGNGLARLRVDDRHAGRGGAGD